MENLPHKNIDRRSFLIGLAGLSTAAITFSSPLLTSCAPTQNNGATTGGSEGSETGGDYDIIIVGAGGAGMNATLSAHEAGAKVLLLEKMGIVGGNTNFAEGGMNASETSIQQEEGIEDSNELFASDTFEGGHELGNMDLINYMCSNSNAAIERLSDRGMHLTKISTSGGASVPRIHRPEDGSPVGAYFVKNLSALCDQEGIGALTGMDVTEIRMEDGKVAGVVANDGKRDIIYNAPAVIIATGGFGANHQKLAEYRPELLEAVTTNHAGALGEGIEMAEAIGADVVDMKEIQVHPTVEQKTSILLSEGIRGDGAVLINSEGNRFTDELLTRDVVTAAEWAQPGGWAYAVFDNKVYEDNTAIEEKFVKNDLVISADTLEELAAKLEVDSADNFMAALTTYNGAIEADTAAAGGEYKEEKGVTSDPHGRWKSRYLIDEAPFYAIKIAPGIHHTMGGLKIDVDTQVLNKSDEPILGLFAAGEVTGGIHGGNRLGGNAMCDINVYGHRAAESALSYLDIA